MIKNLKIFVFDMGRVITKPARIDMIYEGAKMKCTYPEFKKYFYQSKEADEVYKGTISDDDFFNYIRTVCQTDLSVKQLEELYTMSKGGIYLNTVKAIKDLKEKGNSVHLLSNIKQIDYDYLSQNIDLAIFDELFLSYKLGMSKPHEDIYNYVINALGTNEFHFFDDSEENVKAANKLGISAHLTTGDNIDECLRLIHKK